MIKLVTSLVVIISITSCGVNTSSSSSDSTHPASATGSTSSTDTNATTAAADSTGTTAGSTDTNVTAQTSKNCDTNTRYECNDAVYDANCCSALSYKTASDASYNGTDPAENGSDFFNVANEGLSIRSEHLEGSASDAAKTWVTLYYKSFPTPSDLGLQGYTSRLKTGLFHLSYDIAWSDTSIPNVDRTMYVRTNQGTKPACYRVNLNSVDGASIDVQKVYK